MFLSLLYWQIVSFYSIWNKPELILTSETSDLKHFYYQLLKNDHPYQEETVLTLWNGSFQGYWPLGGVAKGMVLIISDHWPGSYSSLGRGSG